MQFQTSLLCDSPRIFLQTHHILKLIPLHSCRQTELDSFPDKGSTNRLSESLTRRVISLYLTILTPNPVQIRPTLSSLSEKGILFEQS
jgi:hypothetical protein